MGPVAATLGGSWRLTLRDDRRRSFLSHLPSPFPEGTLNGWYHRCINDLQWERPWVQEKRLPRKACWLTMPGVALPYTYGGKTWRSHEMPPWFQAIMERVCQQCGVVDMPNSCNANLYESGQDGVGWHADDEPLFCAKEQDAMIISLSLGETRTFLYRLNDRPDDEHRLPLANGDLCIMEGLMQKYYKHAVGKQPTKTKSRINLTWRWIIQR